MLSAEKITREELYEAVWSEPIHQLSKALGISDVGLAKVCKKLNVPVPGRGYWAKNRATRKLLRISLPLLEAGQPTEHQITQAHCGEAERWTRETIQRLAGEGIRRFDYVIRLDNPPRSVRRRMLEENLKDLPVEGHRKDLLAMHEGLSPALINRVAGVARTIHPVLGQKDAGPVLSQLLGNALEALGHTRNPRVVEVVTDYRPELLNTDCDLSPVLGGLREYGNGRICFYGPPGTGKTAYGHHLAKELDRPLLLKRASDLLNKYVGGTEKLLAAMFEEARVEGAVLLLDEADSFLQERGKAQQSWQVTQVNEMLTQMESFDGIFIASTNLMDQLDAAALRRFDLRVRFDYLRPEQAWIMFQDAASRLGIESDVAMKGCLSSLSILTPGDFATVLRQARMNRPSDSRDLLRRLEAECQVKPDHRRKPIGFSERVAARATGG